MNLAPLTMLSVVTTVRAGVHSLFSFGGHSGIRGRTPAFGGGGRQARYRPHVPNGKWVMKYHRHRQ